MVVTCTQCKAKSIVPVGDRGAGVTRCEQCDTLLDIAATSDARSGMLDEAAAPRRRVEAPAEITVVEEGEASAGYRGEQPRRSVTITRRRRRRSARWLAVSVTVLGALLALWIYDAFVIGSLTLAVVLAIVTAFALPWVLDHLSRFVNSTVIRADAERVTVDDGPLPSVLRRVEISRDDLRQFYSTEIGRVDPGIGPFQVRALLAGDVTAALVDGLDTREEALFIEQQLEGALAIVDREVATEVAREQGQGVPRDDYFTPVDRPRGIGSWLKRVGLASLVCAIAATAIGVYHHIETLAQVELEDEPHTLRFEVGAARSDVYLATATDIMIGDIRPEAELPAFDAVVRLRRVDGADEPTELICEITRRDKTGYYFHRVHGDNLQHVKWHGRLDHCPLPVAPGRWEAVVTRRWRAQIRPTDRVTESQLRVEARR